MDKKDWLMEISSKQQVKKIMDMNEKLTGYGITISEEDALQLLEQRRLNLQEQQRVEFGEGILPKLIDAFSDSTYIYQQNFLEIMERLQEIFYEYKNETIDELIDDELIQFIYQAFEGECHGSVDYLEETILEELSRKIRERGQNFLSHYYKTKDVEDE